MNYPTTTTKKYVAPTTADNTLAGIAAQGNPYEYNPGGQGGSMVGSSGGTQQSGPLSYAGGTPQRSALESLPENLAQAYQNTLQGMLTGDAYSAYRLNANQGMGRAAQQLRARTAAESVGRAGQGTAIAQKNATEAAIAQGAGQTALDAMMGEQAMKQEGMTAANTLVGMNETTRQNDVAEGMKADSLYGYTDPNTGKRVSGSLEQGMQTVAQGDRSLDIQEKIGLGDLNIREKQLAEETRQFNTRQEFDQYALERGYTEAEKERAWQANQNDKAQQVQVQIATMQNDTERWKQTRVEELTKLGWDNENAQRQADREQSVVLANMDAALQRELESGRITFQEKQLAQQASQFNDQMSFQKWAEQNNIDQQTAQRAWATTERVATQAYQSSEATLDRQLQKSIEEGRITMQERELLQQASQFEDQMEFNKSELAANLSEADKNRIWQESENVKNRTFQLQLQSLQDAAALKGIQMTTIMSYLESLDPEQAADTMKSLAQDLGITHVVTDADGNPVSDGKGGYQTEKGFATQKLTSAQIGTSILTQLTSGELSDVEFRGADSADSKMNSKYTALMSATKDWDPSIRITDAGMFSGDVRRFNNPPAKGEILKIDGRLYKVTSGVAVDKTKNDYEYFNMIDIASGITTKMTTTMASKIDTLNNMEPGKVYAVPK